MLLIISLFIFSCNKNPKIKQNINTIDSVSIDYNSKIVLLKDSLISFNYYNDNLKDSISNNWKIEQSQILKFLRNSDTLSGYEWNQCYGNFNFGVKGKLIYNENKYDYLLNPGGWIKLKNDKEEKYFGTKNKRDTLIFISIYFCDEEWD